MTQAHHGRKPLGAFIEERTDRLRGDGLTIYSVTNDRGFVPSLDLFDKQVFSADTGNYKRVGHKDIAFNPSRINVGSVALLQDDSGGAVSPMYTVVRCKEGLRPEYLLNYLRSSYGLAEIQRRCEGAVRFMLKFNDLRRIEIPIPSLVDQDRLMSLLDEADALRNLRAQAHVRTAQLIPAIFQEMFGGGLDLAANGHLPCKVADLCQEVVDCPHSTPIYAEERTTYLCVRSSDIQDGAFDWSATKCVDASEYASRVLRLVPQPGDVVYCREGARLGNAAVIPHGVTVCLGQRMMLLRVDRTKAEPEFLSSLLNSSFIRRQVDVLAGGAASPHINVRDVKGFSFHLPELERQQEFAARVSEVRALQAVQCKARAKVEALWGSLLGEVFG